ncbi:RNA ligase [Methylosinus sp. RM1]|uniref:RNA ligase n=1 Tax=Methylosinus sp. RM1 TaxID=2583817 RepID=UPI00140D9250|nr:RNA ligase [Methylosinus sp. RM1]
MKYAFPLIRHLDDIDRHRDAGLMHEAFKRGERHNGTIVYDYAYMDNQVFPPIGATQFAALARELRGLTFDAKNGALLSRPYQKFFNAGEREETLATNLPLADRHLVLEKLDGSMIHAFIRPDGALAFATRWGVSDIARQALAWYETQDGDGAGRAALRDLVVAGLTPIFEWTSPENIVVVRHAAPALTLTGLRERETGDHVAYAQLADHARRLRVPLVRAFDSIADWDSFSARAFAETEGEGYVVRFDDGHMLKVKNTLYARVHKFKAHLAQPKDAAEIIVSGALDDMLPHLSAAERSKIEAYRDCLRARLSATASRLAETIARAREEITTQDPRERQKLFWTLYAAPLGAALSGSAVDVWLERRDAFAAIDLLLLKNTSANARFQQIVAALDLPELAFGFDGDQ